VADYLEDCHREHLERAPAVRNARPVPKEDAREKPFAKKPKGKK
jgi:hypothetical protein